MILSALLGDAAPVRVQLWNGPDASVLGSKFPRAHVLDPSGLAEADLDLEHLGLGLYGYPGGYAAPSVGRRPVQFEVFSDSGRTAPDLAYPLSAAELLVAQAATFADDAPGAAARAWLQLFDGNTGAHPRLRVYDSAGVVAATVNAQAGAQAGLYLAQFTAPPAGWYTLQWVTYQASDYVDWDPRYPALAEPYKTGVTLFPGPRVSLRSFTLRGDSPVFRLASR